MSHPTCYCWPASLDRCDRCDLLVNLEGFHLMSVARTPSRACQRVPSPNSLAWAGPYASGRMPSWPTSTQEEPATAPPKPSTDIIELGRRTARGYRNPTNYKLRMLLIAGGLDASTHTQL